ncbi:DUF3093 domain-containing protein [Microbacterium sp. Marseille-Q6965]|uniref:DUF3093 domain-containing protein n=1 Tax=Microbacterium sp. Marseille-Q6965 TaxID=2965072 RepID=UPI0021B802C1|nr:DUF3093 domain-containing protein [Microbacterium sp. Marseille-Q6965]
MQNTSTPIRSSQATYRERLSPSLWLLGGAAVVAPMASLVFVQIDRALALVIGVAVAIAVVALLVGLAPTVEVRGSRLRAGRAHIDVGFLGEPVALTGPEARAARGRDIDAHGWHLIRGGIDGLVVVPNTDPDDPVGSWTISSRTPDRLAAAIRLAQRS